MDAFGLHSGPHINRPKREKVLDRSTLKGRAEPRVNWFFFFSLMEQRVLEEGRRGEGKQGRNAAHKYLFSHHGVSLLAFEPILNSYLQAF